MLPLLLSRPAFLNQMQSRFFPFSPLLSDLLIKYYYMLLFYHNSIAKSICNRLPEQDFSTHDTNFRVRYKKQREPSPCGTSCCTCFSQPFFFNHRLQNNPCPALLYIQKSHHFIGCYGTIFQHIFINAPFLFTIRHFIGTIRHFVGTVGIICVTIQAVGIIAPFFSCTPIFVHGN